jgi:hypothetical protein
MDKRFEEGEWPEVSITIKNDGKQTVTIVKPGDGSESGWRTPTIGWSFVSADSMKPHPKKAPTFSGGRCKLMNPLQAEEIVEVKPGESLEINEWINHYTTLKAGKYRAVIYYDNDPALKWQGTSSHDSDAMKLVKASTKISLVSNEIKFEVVAKKKK